MYDVYTMSGSRQSNQANLGFFPTDLKVVELEMNLIDFSELSNSNIEINIADITGGEGDQLNQMYDYLTMRNIKTNCYYNELNEDRYNSCVSKYPHFTHNMGNAKNLKIGSKKNKIIDKKVFTIIRNNPPYGYDKDNNGVSVRLERVFYSVNNEYDIVGGIHILEVPIGIVDKDFLSLLSYKYNYKLYKFPKGEFEKYKQVCIIMQKKKDIAKNTELVKKVLEDITNDMVLELDKVTQPVFKLSLNSVKKASPVYYFRNNIINTETLHNGAMQVFEDITKINKKRSKNYTILKEKPIIELLQGHVSSLLASGRYNGIMNNFLIAAGSNKVVKSLTDTDENGKEFTTEIESLQPYLEITNKAGEILCKDF